MLEVSGLSVSYGETLALRDVSIKADVGGITTVLGGNGAGKSTLLRTICGLVKSNAGTIRAMGEDLLKLSPAKIVRCGVCMVPEGRELFPRMTVYENLMVGAYLRSDKTSIRRDLDKVYDYFPVLSMKEKLLARNLSGGEQQMVALGRALMAAPKMLLLDEPSIGLAPLVEQQLMKTLRLITDASNIGIVLVEQNAVLALSVSDSGYVLELGSKVLEGPAEDLLHDPEVKRAYLGI